MQNLIYWSPFLGNVGTVKSTLNSALAFKKFSKNKYNVKIINVFGEWNNYKNILKKSNIELINLTFTYINFLPKDGFIKSRISYTLIFLISFFPLLRLLKKENNSIFIAHLITSLALFINSIFKINSKIILRISGYPKLHFVRKKFWQLTTKKVFSVTCPTEELMKKLQEFKILVHPRIKFLPDAIIDINDFLIQKNEKIDLPTKKKFLLSVGRLTKQKNYSYLLDEIKNFLKSNNDYDLIILGDGEDREIIKKKIKDLNMNDRIYILGHKNNPYSYMINASALILSSLWEEVGFVIVEAALSNLLVFSSNCPNGPKEFLENGRAGFLFNTNEKNALENEIHKISSDNFKKKIFAKKNCLKYTKLRHFRVFSSILTV